MSSLLNTFLPRLRSPWAPAALTAKESAPSLPQGDQDALKQIVLILIDNALKYSQDDITLQVRLVGHEVQIQVQDHGKGIPPDELAHVFDRFYRAEEAAIVPGFGLGLPIVKALVEAMDGKITLESQEGRSSTVTVSFIAAKRS